MKKQANTCIAISLLVLLGPISAQLNAQAPEAVVTAAVADLPISEVEMTTGPNLVIEFPIGTPLEPTAAVLDFDRLLVGARDGQRLALRNIGTEPLLVESLTLTGSSGFELGQPPLNPVPVGGVVFVDVICAPTEVGQLQAVLHVVSNADNHPNYAVELFATGVSAPGSIDLVRVLSADFAGLNPTHLMEMEGYVLFAATTPDAGTELWRTDGTAAGTFQLVDIWAGGTGSQVANLTRAGNQAFFTASTSANGVELWVTDGTTEGTRLVRDIFTGSTSSSPSNLTVMNGVLYFSAATFLQGSELWRSDGTVGGTVLVKDIRPSTLGSNPQHLVALGNALYFVANDGVTGMELWKSDGTDSGTALLKDLFPGSDGSGVANLTVMGDTLFFTATDGTHGTELWKSDGTPEGTVMVTDIEAGMSGSGPASLVSLDGWLYFRATTAAHGAELWKSDGTPAGTILVKDVQPGTESGVTTPLVKHGTSLFFAATDGVHGSELWTSDGSSSGTVLVKDLFAGADPSSPSDLVSVGSTLFFSAQTTSGRELWKTNGTDLGTVQVKDIATGAASSSPARLTALGELLLFAANDQVTGQELWRSDGTDAGTYPVGAGLPGVAGSSFANLRNINGQLYFGGNDGAQGMELWRSDGSSLGTTLVKDINSGMPSANPDQMMALGPEPGAAFVFAATTPELGRELYRSDGTPGGTALVMDIVPGPASSIPANFLRIGSTVFFTANHGVHGIELWKTDGTEAGTQMVADINPGSASSGPSNLVDLNGVLIFSAITATAGQEPWRSDGTAAGTYLVKDIVPGSGNSVPGFAAAAVVGNELFFTAGSPAEGRELWKTDGTEAGTVLVRDIFPGVSPSGNSNHVNVGGVLLFAAADGSNGLELWRSDGTAGGTFMVKDIYPGSPSSSPSGLFSTGSHAYFMANDGSSGSELWRSDGTAAGTIRVKDIAPGSASSAPSLFTTVNGKLIFRATTPEQGLELWTTDGTEAGTRLVADLFPGVVSSNPTNLTAVGSRLFFTATHPQTSSQLFVIDTAGPGRLTVEQPFGLHLVSGVSQAAFEPTLPASSSSLTFHLGNTGWSPLTPGSVAITGPDAAAFTVGELSVASIQPGGAATLLVTFSPSAVRTHSATLEIATDDPTQPLFLVALSGDGLPVPTLVVEQPTGISLTPEVSTVEFGSVTLAGTAASRNGTLRNAQPTTLLQIQQLTLAGANPTDFVIENNPMGSSITGAQTRGFSLRFAPRALGLRTATLSIASNDPVVPDFTVLLSGFGMAAPGPGQEIVMDQVPARPPTSAPFFLPAYASSGLPLSYELLAGPATVGANGLVTPTGGSGAVTVRVSQSGDSGYDPAEVYVTFTLAAWPAFIKIAALTNSKLCAGIRADGTLWTWGNGSVVGALGDTSELVRVTPTQVGVATNWAEVALGSNFGLGLRTNGTLWGWGHNVNGQVGNGTTNNLTLPVQVATGRSWRQVAAGPNFSAAVATDGTLWTWGSNGSGQLGHGDTAQRNAPTQVGTESDWSQVTCGYAFMLGIKANGELWSWGINLYGQLGHGTTGQQVAPIRVGSASDWVDVAAGFGQVLARRADGGLWAWGMNSAGQLGIGNTTHQSLPIRVGTDSDWDQIACGTFNSGARKRNGTVWAWGNNQYGQLGVSAVGMRTTPQRFLSGSDWLEIQVGESTIAALGHDGQIWVTGENDGFTGISPRALTRAATAAGSWSMLAGNGNHFLAVRSNGSLWGWGKPGALGDGSFFENANLTQQGIGQSWTAVSAAMTGTTTAYSLAIREDGSLWATGSNGNGVLGDGTTTFRNSWVPVTSNPGWSQVAAGTSSAVGIRNDGTLWTWGANTSGQLGQGSSGGTPALVPTQVGVGDQWVAAAAGVAHVAAIRSDGTLWTWGFNFFGQLGHGDNANRTSPVQVGNGTDWVAVACGDHTLAVKADGSLWGWGRNHAGQLGLGDMINRNAPTRVGTANHWAKIAVSRYTSAALTTAGGLWTAGENYTGVLGNGTTANALTFAEIANAGFDQVTVGEKTLLASRPDGTLWTAGTSGPTLLEGGRQRHLAAPVLPTLSPQTIVPPPLGALSGQVRSTSGLPALVTLVSGPGEVNGDEIAHTGPEGSVATFLAWQPGDAQVWNAAPPLQFSIIRAAGGIQLFEGTLAGRRLQSNVDEVTHGTVLVGSPNTRLFTVLNSGEGPLLISDLSATGDWSLNLSNTVLSLPAGASTTFTAIFTPTVQGTRTGQIVIASNDEDESVFTVPVSGNGGLAQNLTFNSIPTQVCGTPLVLTATASSGLAVQYAITAGAAICSLENGVLTFTSSGSVTIQATQPGDATFVSAAPISRSFSVIRGNQVLTFGPEVPASISHRATVGLSATSDRGLTPVLFSRLSGPGIVLGSTLTFTGPGAVVVRASQAGNAAFNTGLQEKTITATNAAPITQPASAQGDEDTLITGSLTATDADGDSVQFAKFSDPAHGSVVVQSNGGFSYSPAADYHGEDSFLMRAYDGFAWSAPALVTVTVFPINDAPLALPQALETPDSVPLPITLTGTDVDGNTLTFQLVDAPVHGTLTGSPPEVIYTSEPGYAGPDSFSFKVSDGQIESAPATISLTVTPVGLTVVTPPADLAVSLAGTGQFKMVVAGTQPVSFQWKKGGVDLAGEVTDTLVIQNATLADVGHYSCTATNEVNSVTSASAQLEVITNMPRLVESPSHRLVHTGGVIHLQVVALGAPPLRYQWKKNGRPIPGATGPRLSFWDASLPMAGAYSVRVSATQTVESAVAQVGVVDDQPDTVVLEQGGKAILKARTAGNGLHHEWQRDGEPLPADPRFKPTADGRTLVIDTLQPADAANYGFRVTGPGGVISGATTDLGVFNTAPTITQPQNLPNGIVGGVFNHQIQVEPGLSSRPSRYRAVGLPPGLKLNPKTGLISGQPTKAGFFPVRMSVSNRRSSATLTETLHIAALPVHLVGSYTGIIARSPSLNQQLGGALTFQVTQTAAYSGQLDLAGTQLRFKGVVMVDKDGLLPPRVSIKIPRPGKPAPQPVTLEFEIATSPGQLIGGRLVADDAEAAVEGWRQTRHKRSNPALSRQGYHTFAMQPDVPPNASDLPQGSGFGSFTISAGGTLGIAARLADGTAFTRSTFIGPEGQIGLFSLLYGPARPRGSVVGILHQGLGENLTSPRDNPLTGSLSWSRPPRSVKGSPLYPAGFDPIELAVIGGFFDPPTSLLGRPPGIRNTQLSFTEGGLDFSATDPTVKVSSDATHRILVEVTPARVSLSINPKQAPFSGSFQLGDLHWNQSSPNEWTRRVRFQGLVILSQGEYSGHGYFLLPQLPFANPKTNPPPTWSGRVTFLPTSPP